MIESAVYGFEIKSFGLKSMLRQFDELCYSKTSTQTTLQRSNVMSNMTWYMLSPEKLYSIRWSVPQGFSLRLLPQDIMP